MKGVLKYYSTMARLEGDEERFVLLAMHQMLVERGLSPAAADGQGESVGLPQLLSARTDGRMKY